MNQNFISIMLIIGTLLLIVSLFQEFEGPAYKTVTETKGWLFKHQVQVTKQVGAEFTIWFYTFCFSLLLIVIGISLLILNNFTVICNVTGKKMLVFLNKAKNLKKLKKIGEYKIYHRTECA